MMSRRKQSDPVQVRRNLELHRKITRHLPPFEPEELARRLTLDYQAPFDQEELASWQTRVREDIPRPDFCW